MNSEILWCKITQSGLLRFDGADAQSFLQGQLTNNVTALDAMHSQYTGYCTAKGRLLAMMLMWQHDGAYCMMLPRELCEPVRKRLSMYILRAQVKAAEISAEHMMFGLSGAGAPALLATLGIAAPAAVHEVAYANGIALLKLPVDRYLIVASTAAAGHIESLLTNAAPAAAETCWAALDIEAGIPAVVAATQEQFVPQTVNFDLIDAVSFDKGCYPGQEIVARTHYLGRVKQRMVRARLRSSDAPAAGDKLYSAPYGDQASGMIVSAVRNATGDHELLAVIQVASLATSTIHWKTVDGPGLEIVPLPYAVN